MVKGTIEKKMRTKGYQPKFQAFHNICYSEEMIEVKCLNVICIDKRNLFPTPKVLNFTIEHLQQKNDRTMVKFMVIE